MFYKKFYSCVIQSNYFGIKQPNIVIGKRDWNQGKPSSFLSENIAGGQIILCYKEKNKTLKK